MSFFDSIKNIVGSVLPSPKLGLKLLHTTIENEIGTKFPKGFTYMYSLEKEESTFLLETGGEKRKYPFEGERAKQLSEVIIGFCKSELKSGEKLDYIIVEYTPDSCNAKLYYRDGKNEKQFLNVEL